MGLGVAPSYLGSGFVAFWGFICMWARMAKAMISVHDVLVLQYPTHIFVL
jgi:hypothetical protein